MKVGSHGDPPQLAVRVVGFWDLPRAAIRKSEGEGKKKVEISGYSEEIPDMGTYGLPAEVG